jgi:hypothetical protein
MASGRRLRKVFIWSGLLIVAAVTVTMLIFRDEVTLRYHKNRLQAAKARHWRLTTKGYTAWDHIAVVLRGRPVSADEVVATWKRHEEALVQRGFLSRKMYVAADGVLPSRSTNPEYNNALARMEGSCPWWSVSRVGSNLIVTACRQGHADWKAVAPRAGLRAIDEVPVNGQKAKKRCWRKRKNSRLTETLAGKVSSGYSIDDEFFRTRIFVDGYKSFAAGEP